MSRSLPQKVVVLKDETNKAAHEVSAHLACEAAGAIRTVASLTREDHCCVLYSESLLEPLRESKKSAIRSNLLFAFSQAIVFFVVSLVFWYGTRLVASTEYSTQQFFIVLTVRPDPYLLQDLAYLSPEYSVWRSECGKRICIHVCPDALD